MLSSGIKSNGYYNKKSQQKIKSWRYSQWRFLCLLIQRRYAADYRAQEKHGHGHRKFLQKPFYRNEREQFPNLSQCKTLLKTTHCLWCLLKNYWLSWSACHKSPQNAMVPPLTPGTLMDEPIIYPFTIVNKSSFNPLFIYTNTPLPVCTPPFYPSHWWNYNIMHLICK